MRPVVAHKTVEISGVRTFYREAGDHDAPTLLMPHGYPSSSYEFRNLMPLLADQWHVIAPDFPGSGYSATPEDHDFSFDGQARFLAAFADQLGLEQFFLYLHDFGSQIGLRLAVRHPNRVLGLIIQNGDIYEDVLGPKYDALKELWEKPRAEAVATLSEGLSKEEFKREFLNDLPSHMAQMVPPDLWELHWSLMTERRKDIAAAVIADLKENLSWFPRYQHYLRTNQPPALIVWGPHDGYMPEASARAYLRDLPNADVNILNGGHWLLKRTWKRSRRLSVDSLASTRTRSSFERMSACHQEQPLEEAERRYKAESRASELGLMEA
jgi:pimeloyl-ACP methyl ester carboxylesterase